MTLVQNEKRQFRDDKKCGPGAGLKTIIVFLEFDIYLTVLHHS